MNSDKPLIHKKSQAIFFLKKSNYTVNVLHTYLVAMEIFNFPCTLLRFKIKGLTEMYRIPVDMDIMPVKWHRGEFGGKFNCSSAGVLMGLQTCMHTHTHREM